jgi:hypothetical protein
VTAATAAVKPASAVPAAVESASTMECAAAVETSTTVVAAYGVTVAFVVSRAAAISVASSGIPSAVGITPTIAVTRAISITAISVAVTVTEPRACTDEDAAAKPSGAVITIGRTRVGVVAVITIAADRRAIRRAIITTVRRAYSYTKRYLGAGVGRREKQNTKKSKIAEKSHGINLLAKPCTRASVTSLASIATFAEPLFIGTRNRVEGCGGRTANIWFTVATR